MFRVSPATGRRPLNFSLVAFRAASAPRPESGGAGEAAARLPERFLVLPWGRHETGKGTVICNAETARVLASNQVKMKRPRVKVDFEHESCRPDVKHPIRYAAEGTPAVVPGEGVWLENVVWTDAGLQHVPTDYGDISPAVYRDDSGVVIGLHSVAVCAHGEIDNLVLTPLSADLSNLELPSAQSSASPSPMEELVIKLLKAMGVEIAEGATPEQIAAAAAAALEKAATTEKPDAPAEGGEGAKPDAFSAELAALKQTVTALSAAVEGITKNSAKAEAQAMIDKAVAAGKLVQLSADDLVNLGPARAKAYLDALKPDVVPLSQRTPAALSAGASLHARDADEERALRDLGIDPAALK